MLGKTHVLGGTAAALGGFIVLQDKGLLYSGFPAYQSLAIMLPYAIWSSTLADFDQENKDMAARSPINAFFQKFFKLIGAGHRSFKSHVLPVLIMAVLTLGIYLGFIKSSGGVVSSINLLILTGMTFGYSSHMILDMFTSGQVEIWPEHKFGFVPRESMFNAGSPYEDIVRRVLYVATVFLLLFIAWRGVQNTPAVIAIIANFNK